MYNVVLGKKASMVQVQKRAKLQKKGNVVSLQWLENAATKGINILILVRLLVFFLHLPLLLLLPRRDQRLARSTMMLSKGFRITHLDTKSIQYHRAGWLRVK
jgi:hypothetical protein